MGNVEPNGATACSNFISMKKVDKFCLRILDSCFVLVFNYEAEECSL